MDVEVGQPSRVARVRALSTDRTRMWIELHGGATASATSDPEPFDFAVGDVMLVRPEDNFVERAPREVWPESTDDNSGSDEHYVGVVRLRDYKYTLIEVGYLMRPVPTNDEVKYDIGFTVEATDATGVIRVLSEDPIRIGEQTTLSDDEVADAFLRKPTGDLTFHDFGGLHEVHRRARELIELPLKRADKLDKIGAEPIRGVLFTGPPGTGKTMLARIIASTTEANFYAVSGPTVFSKWYGESEEILRRIFAHAAENGPSIIFFDEIDSIAGQRNEDAHEASKRVVAQLLTLLDGLDVREKVVVIAATNRPQDIDVALRRPGRFDWQIDFPYPKLTDRNEILEVRGRKLAVDGPLPHAWVAANTEGWSAAELSAIWKEAALLAAADDREAITMEDYLGGYERAAAQRRLVASKAPGERS